MNFVVVPSARTFHVSETGDNAHRFEKCKRSKVLGLTDAAIRKEDEEGAGPEEDGHAEQAEDRADHDEDDIGERMPRREVVRVLPAQEIPHERVHVPHRLPATISLAS